MTATIRQALEVAVASPSGAAAARMGGADRVELCGALELGGVTPSQGLTEAAVADGLPVHALVRCRPGDFVYDDDEIALMEREIAALIASGVSGVAVGALDERGRLDEDAMARFVGAARSARADCEITMHRAIDHAADPVSVIAGLEALNVDRVLTSGAASRAIDGSPTISRLLAARGHVQVMAGGGVAPEDIAALVALGVDAVHLSAKSSVAGRPRADVSLGVADGADVSVSHYVTSAEIVAAARAALDALRP